RAWAECERDVPAGAPAVDRAARHGRPAQRQAGNGLAAGGADGRGSAHAAAPLGRLAQLLTEVRAATWFGRLLPAGRYARAVSDGSSRYLVRRLATSSSHARRSAGVGCMVGSPGWYS